MGGELEILLHELDNALGTLSGEEQYALLRKLSAEVEVRLDRVRGALDHMEEEMRR